MLAVATARLTQAVIQADMAHAQRVPDTLKGPDITPQKTSQDNVLTWATIQACNVPASIILVLPYICVGLIADPAMSKSDVQSDIRNTIICLCSSTGKINYSQCPGNGLNSLGRAHMKISALPLLHSLEVSTK